MVDLGSDNQDNMTGKIQFIDDILNNPIISSAILKNPHDAMDIIDSMVPEEYHELAMNHLESKHPAIYEAIANRKSKEIEIIPAKELQRDILMLHGQGYSIRQIASILSEDYDQDIPHSKVARILNSVKKTPNTTIEPSVNSKLDDAKMDLILNALKSIKPRQINLTTAAIITVGSSLIIGFLCFVSGILIGRWIL